MNIYHIIMLVLCWIFPASLAIASDLPKSYSIIIHSSCGESTRLEAVAHDIVFDNRVLSIVGMDHKRYLINLDGKSVEFSKELDVILKSKSNKIDSEQ